MEAFVWFFWYAWVGKGSYFNVKRCGIQWLLLWFSSLFSTTLTLQGLPCDFRLWFDSLVEVLLSCAGTSVYFYLRGLSSELSKIYLTRVILNSRQSIIFKELCSSVLLGHISSSEQVARRHWELVIGWLIFVLFYELVLKKPMLLIHIDLPFSYDLSFFNFRYRNFLDDWRVFYLFCFDRARFDVCCYKCLGKCVNLLLAWSVILDLLNV